MGSNLQLFLLTYPGLTKAYMSFCILFSISKKIQTMDYEVRSARRVKSFNKPSFASYMPCLDGSILLNAFSKGTTSELASFFLFSHYPSMLSFKGTCKRHLLAIVRVLFAL